jgi:hypothetical protein
VLSRDPFWTSILNSVRHPLRSRLEAKLAEIFAHGAPTGHEWMKGIRSSDEIVSSMAIALLEKVITDDPAYETVKARRAIARFVSLHEHNLAQKAEIVVEHFRAHIAGKVAGRAKAMVVCGSREHAVRFWQALRAYVDHHGYDLGVLVAFSGAVTINGDESVTEYKCNGYPDSQTAAQFDTDAYRIMVVAEKFQTGFDQPKLYAMYVDKTLTGLAAVQTLSRLNRTHPDKDGTFVLDFVNDAEDIAAAFEPYYARTVAPPSDPEPVVRHPARPGRVRRPQHGGGHHLRSAATRRPGRSRPAACRPRAGH